MDGGRKGARRREEVRDREKGQQSMKQFDNLVIL